MKKLSLYTYPAKPGFFAKGVLLFFVLVQSLLFAQPAGYYNSTDGLVGEDLKTALYGIINNHTVLSYTPGVWNAFTTTDVRNGDKIWDIYSDIPGGTPPYEYTVITNQCGSSSGEGSCYSREHSFPSSYFNDASPMYTDVHHLFPVDQYVNATGHSNHPFGEVNIPTYVSQNGSKRGPCAFPGYLGTVFEPIDAYKGDIARAYFYMATRYQNLIGSWQTNAPEADAILDGSSFMVFESWFLNLLLQWHQLDPVSTKEIDRNNAIYTIQGNRNPYIDHPEYVQLIWNLEANLAVEPSNHPTGMAATTVTNSQIDVTWTDALAGSQAPSGYLVLAATSASFNNPIDGLVQLEGTFVKNVAAGEQHASFTGLDANTTYYFKIFPFNGASSTINYKTNEVAVTASATTLPLLNAPLVQTTTNNSATSVTLHWEPVNTATNYAIEVYTKQNIYTSDLLISEYVEGSSNNKYIEIFNGTGSSVNLSDYKLRLFSNGANTPSNDVALSGVLEYGNTVVYKNSSATIYTGTSTTNTAVNFNGDDAVALFKVSTNAYVDIFGVIGNDPGIAWTGVGGYTTLDKTLVRKENVLSGVTTNPTGGGTEAFLTLTMEWNVSDSDVVSNLGSHTYTSLSTNYVIQNLQVGNVTSYTLQGLSPDTTYYYVVKAYSTVSESPNSVEASFYTSHNATIWNGTAWSLGEPTMAMDAIIQEDFTATTVINARDLVINESKNCIIPSTQRIKVSGNLVNHGQLIFKSDAAGTAVMETFDGVVSGSGNVKVERYIPSKRAWRLLTSPLKQSSNHSIFTHWQNNGINNGNGLLLWHPNGSASPATSNSGFYQGTLPNLYTYHGSWAAIANTNDALLSDGTRNHAYLAFVTGPHASNYITSSSVETTLEATGQLITGDVNYSGLTTNAFQLIANPYASPISTSALKTTNPDFNIWLLDPTLGTIGGYYTYDGNNWTPETPAGDAVNIQSGQGFFVRSASATSFNINESHKAVGNSNTWFAKPSVQTTEENKIRVLLEKQENNQWQLVDGILSVSGNNYANAVDAQDALKVSNFNENILFRNGTSNLAIEYQNMPTTATEQPIRLTGTTATAYRLRVKTEGFVSVNVQPILQDTQSGTNHLIPTDGSTIEIPFTGVVATTTNPDQRFKIVYQQVLGVDQPITNTLQVYPNPVTEGQFTMVLPNPTEVATYEITNYLGQVVQKGELAPSNSKVSVAHQAAGVYLVKVQQNGLVYLTKVLKKNGI